LGLSLIFGEGSDIETGKVFNVSTSIGTLCYTAPEVRFSKLYSTRSDVWSIGVMLCVLLTGTFPFPSPFNDSKNLTMEKYDELLKKKNLISVFTEGKVCRHVSKEAKDLINKLLKINRDERLSIEAALTHPWISNRPNLLVKPFPEDYFRLIQQSRLNRQFKTGVYVMMF
jgi:serine/threonine protein kinase